MKKIIKKIKKWWMDKEIKRLLKILQKQLIFLEEQDKRIAGTFFEGITENEKNIIKILIYCLEEKTKKLKGLHFVELEEKNDRSNTN